MKGFFMIKEIHLFLKTILTNTEFEGKTYFVGGCVRDYYRDIKAHDVDIVVDMKDGAKKLSHFIYNYFKERLCDGMLKSTITSPYQLGHYPIYSISFKDNFAMPGHFYVVNGITIEIADTMKEEFPDEDSRQREVSYGSLEEDIMRRDYSINSGLIDVVSFEFKDLTPDKTILNDIEKGIIRCNMDYAWYINEIFSNDPLRILRGVVFAARFNFNIDIYVKCRMIDNIHRLKIVSRERINAEITKSDSSLIQRLKKGVYFDNNIKFDIHNIKKHQKSINKMYPILKDIAAKYNYNISFKILRNKSKSNG